MFYAEVVLALNFRMQILGKKAPKLKFGSAYVEALARCCALENVEFIRKDAGFVEMRNRFAFHL